jgi:hypothetical protein
VIGGHCVFLLEATMLKVEQSRISRSSVLKQWHKQSPAVRFKHGLPAASKPWTARPTVGLRGVPRTDRVLDNLDTCFAYEMSKAPGKKYAEVVKHLYCNISQAVGRLPVSHTMPTPGTRTMVYSFEYDTVVSGKATMQLLGWPDNLVTRDFFSDCDYRQLGGMGFSVPISGMFMAVLYSNPFAPWRPDA